MRLRSFRWQLRANISLDLSSSACFLTNVVIPVRYRSSFCLPCERGALAKEENRKTRSRRTKGSELAEGKLTCHFNCQFLAFVKYERRYIYIYND